MPGAENIGRRQAIPVLYTRGTHYEVGFDVGRTFSGIIHSYIQDSETLHEYLEAYATTEGRKAYDDTFKCVKENFPQYVKELEGTADGAGVPFYKLFLFHMDNVILHAVKNKTIDQPTGCSTICINQNEQLLGHTEDAHSSTLNHYYFVSAHITSESPQGKWGVKEEKFTSLCYAGHLPGYTMSYNHHGFIFSINTTSAMDLRPGKTPRHFIARALLSAETFEQAQAILRDKGCGAADGCSINMTFLNQEGDRLFHNAEMGPAIGKSNESQLNILTISPGETMMHCNSYQRLRIEEASKSMTDSSVARLNTFQKYKKPRNEEDLKAMLSDKSHPKYKVFRSDKDDFVKTICVGIFNCVKRTWSLYSYSPKESEPVVVLPLEIKT